MERFPFTLSAFSPPGSGKTTFGYRLLENGVEKGDHVILISTSLDDEPKLQMILKHFDKKGISYEAYDDFYEETEDGKRDVLEDYVKYRKDLAKEKKRLLPVIDELKYRIKNFHKLLREKNKQQKLPGERGPLRLLDEKEDAETVDDLKETLVTLQADLDEIQTKMDQRTFVVLDDMDRASRKGVLTKLYKIHRRFNMAIIQLGHSPKELMPDARRQLDYLVLFPKINRVAIGQLYDEFMFLDFNKKEFSQFYKDITGKDGYDFLFYDKNNSEFRKNFDKPLKIEFN
jgi:KaiC/GvpD/RAD55 family RecA-like ATPase